MAVQSVANPAHQEFLSLSGNYLISPDSSPEAIMDDAGCWLDGAMAIVSSLAIELQDGGSPGAISPDQAAGMLLAAHHLLMQVDGALNGSREAMHRERTNGKEAPPMHKAGDSQRAAAVTREAHFQSLSAAPGSQLLSVRPGTDAVTALEHASCVLDCVHDQLGAKVSAPGGASARDLALWECALEQSLAVIESCIGGLTDAGCSPNAAEAL